MHINRQDGSVSYPNGISISPALTQDEFRAIPALANARSQDYGTLPWMHYHFSGGEVDGKDLFASVCYYDQMLVDASISADLYPPGPKDWSRYSLEIEAATKQFHDQLLEQILGPPSDGRSWRRLPEGQATLDRPLGWRFPWGRVSSFHDSKGGGTYITISYGDRKEEASKAYRRRTGVA